ncbi:hypothetical protein [Streptomyces apricus]|uniref:Uncharacterized protein n=1 Tax=Streptomyces apricus TaxID=1828112 RepID=A0A5B0BDT1_9ACTN|nr:hypothetical protein [Streptomyces apricus]KAA0940388.1 hypothetical protein FGF04_09870 [Streptomyces apricus]
MVVAPAAQATTSAQRALIARLLGRVDMTGDELAELRATIAAAQLTSDVSRNGASCCPPGRDDLGVGRGDLLDEQMSCRRRPSTRAVRRNALS